MNKKFLQITSGRGPVECARVVGIIFGKIVEDAEKRGLTVGIIETVEHNRYEGCFMSVVISLSSDDKDALCGFENDWNGTIQYISTKNQYRPNHGRKNWFVGVNFFSELELMQVSDKDIKYETMRASGPGGQNVNKVETAVRAIYIPTGLSVVSSEQRNQSQNKKTARDKLLIKLTEIEEEKKAEQDRAVWMNHNLLVRGNPVQTFKGSL